MMRRIRQAIRVYRAIAPWRRSMRLTRIDIIGIAWRSAK